MNAAYPAMPVLDLQSAAFTSNASAIRLEAVASQAMGCFGPKRRPASNGILDLQTFQTGMRLLPTSSIDPQRIAI